jgi:hypothetical protein
MSKEEIEFYGNMIIQQAKLIGDKTVKDSKRPWGSDYAFAWILKQHDNGNLKEFISEELLRYSVNYSFNEILEKNTDFNWVADKHVEYFNFVMKYSGLLEPEKIDVVCNPKRMLYDNNYVKLFDGLREKLPVEKASRFAAPIMNYLVSAIGGRIFKYSKESAIEKLRSELENYKEYMKTPCIKQTLMTKLEDSIGNIHDSDAHGYVRITEFYASLLGISKKTLANIVSKKITKDPYVIMKAEVPKEWLTPEVLEIVASNLFNSLKNDRKKRRGREIVPDLQNINNAIDYGFLEVSAGKSLIEQDLMRYLKEKRRRSKSSLEQLTRSLHSEYIDPELYEGVVKKANESIGGNLNIDKFPKKGKKYFYGVPLETNKLVPAEQITLDKYKI